MTAELNVGQEVDTTGTRLEQGDRAIVEARIWPWRNLQIEPRLIREELRHRDGPEAGRILQRDQTIQRKSYLRLSPRDSLRVVWQRGSLVRPGGSRQLFLMAKLRALSIPAIRCSLWRVRTGKRCPVRCMSA